MEKFFLYFGSILLSFLVTAGAVPLIVVTARKRNLVYAPNQRSAHQAPVPALGGIAIFAGILFSIAFSNSVFGEFKYVMVAAASMIFLLGLFDDLFTLKAGKKLLVMVLISLMLVYHPEFRIHNLHGFLNITDIPVWLSVVVSFSLYIFLINAINLIDGVDGLCAGLGILILGIFYFLFIFYTNDSIIILIASIIAALMGFIGYNIGGNRLKIFMGDTGSLLLGFFLSVIVIFYLNKNPESHFQNKYFSPLIVFSMFIVPVFDTLHVSVKRMLKGKSPFSPDKTHIHHTYLNLGLTHIETTLVLLGYTLFFFILNFLLVDRINQNLQLGISILTALALWHLPEYIIRRNMRKYALKRHNYKLKIAA